MRVFRQTGQSLVEFALVLPMLMLLIMGIFDMGRAVFIWASLSNAAREGSRYGAIYPSDDIGIYNAIRSKIVGIDPNTVSINKWCDTGDFSSRLSSCGNARAGKDRIVVEPVYDFHPLVPGISQLWPSFIVRFTSARTVLGSGTGAKYQPPSPTFPPVPTPTPTNTPIPSPTPRSTPTLPPCPTQAVEPTATSGPAPTYSPTPSPTPRPCQPVQATPSQPTATPPGPETPTATPVPGQPTATTAPGQPTATTTATTTATQVAGSSPTATPGGGASPTSTPSGGSPPTATPGGGASPTSTPSGSSPPTATPSGGSSPTPPPPTNTPLPPAATNTSTPTPANIRIVRIVNGSQSDDVNEEYVEIRNSGGSPGNMDGWTLRNDTTGTSFTFSSFTLNPAASVRVWTQSGTNTASDLYWRQSQSVWDNTSACASLQNNQGQSVNQYCY